MADTQAAALLAPFRLDEVETREGSRNKLFTYASTEVVLRRIIETCPQHSWRVNTIQLVKRGDQPEYWLCHGTLEIEGLGARDGIGTAPVFVPKSDTMDLEAPKSAETDAYKRAAVKFGVALHLYSPNDPIRIGAIRRDSNGNSGQRPPAPQRPVSPPTATEETTHETGSCTCPPGLRMLKGTCPCCGAGHMEYHRCKRHE